MSGAVVTPSIGPGAVGMKARSILAAALAGLGEGALWSLPVTALVKETSRTAAGPLASVFVFLTLFTLGVLAATAARSWKGLPVVAVIVAMALGLVQSVLVGSADPLGGTIVVAVSLAAALRVVMIATRDWRDPVSGSLGWGSAVLLLEAVASSSAGWGALPVVIPVFFLSVLASRAITMWPASPEGGGRTASGWPVLTGAVLGAMAAAMAAAIGLGARGGLLEGIGRLVVPLAAVVLVVGVFAMTEKGVKGQRQRGGRTAVLSVMIGLFLLVALAVRFRSRRAGALRIFPGLGLQQHAHGSGGAERIIGLILFLGVAFLLLRAFRFRWAEPEQGRRSRVESPGAVVGAASPFGRSRRERPPRHELPADTVRRWYAQTLLLLGDRGLPKPAWQTPSEFLAAVREAFPACGAGFQALTGAYEDVRYGNRRIDRPALQGLEQVRADVMRTLREAGPINHHDQAEPGEVRG